MISKPAPDGVTVSIPKIWDQVITGGDDINSLTGPSADMPTLTISQAQIHTLGGLMGQDKLNFTIRADLTNLGYEANVAIAIGWDRTGRLIYQSNLKSGGIVDTSFRTNFLPKYDEYLTIGDHTVDIMVQLREVTNEWFMDDGDYTTYTEFPTIGAPVIRSIKVIITA